MVQSYLWPPDLHFFKNIGSYFIYIEQGSLLLIFQLWDHLKVDHQAAGLSGWTFHLNVSLNQLTHSGRIAVVKMTILLRILFIFQTIMPAPSPGLLRNLQLAINRFIWNGKKLRLHQQLLTWPKAEGGLALNLIPWTAVCRGMESPALSEALVLYGSDDRRSQYLERDLAAP